MKNNWQVKNLRNLCKKAGEYGLNAPSVPLTDKLPLYLRITDITETGYYSEKNRVSVNYTGTEKLLRNNDFLFARTGATVGKTYLNKNTTDKIAFAGYLIRFVPDLTKLHPYFLALYCQTEIYWNWVKICSMRSGQPGISAEEYGKMPVPCPPIEEQRKIVEVLETWDKAIGLTKQLIEQKGLQKKYLMQQLLTGRTRLKGFTDKWKLLPLSEILKERKEYQIKNQELPHLSLTKEGVLPKTERYNRDFLVKDEDKLYKITHKNDICYNPANLKFGVICRNQYGSGIFSPIYVTYEVTKYNSGFVGYLLTLPSSIAQARRFEEGTVYERMAVSSEDFLKVKLPFPTCEEESTQISIVIKKAEEEIDLLKQKLAKLEEQKKGLMQVLLTGKVRLVK